jgi:hypothetical protein
MWTSAASVLPLAASSDGLRKPRRGLETPGGAFDFRAMAAVGSW